MEAAAATCRTGWTCCLLSDPVIIKYSSAPWCTSAPFHHFTTVRQCNFALCPITRLFVGLNSAASNLEPEISVKSQKLHREGRDQGWVVDL